MRNLWTPAEDLVLRQHFILGGAAFCKTLLPNRTRLAIRNRAWDIGLRTTAEERTAIRARTSGKGAPWSKDELLILRAYYPQVGPSGLAQFFPKRTRDAIYIKASRLGLRMVADPLPMAKSPAENLKRMRAALAEFKAAARRPAIDLVLSSWGARRPGSTSSSSEEVSNGEVQGR